ncbi:MAG TPA: hypothetical protein VG501_12155 [Rhizomicrobium sp.]|nr:hypothetical protein [Rhizomicrobium sp.]
MVSCPCTRAVTETVELAITVPMVFLTTGMSSETAAATVTGTVTARRGPVPVPV